MNLVITTFDNVKVGSWFRRCKRWWLKDNPFTYVSVHSQVGAYPVRYGLKKHIIVGTKIDDCEDHGKIIKIQRN